MSEKKIAILYHGGCPDGFGSAYAAWKKFGEEADYIPVKHGRPAPTGLEGKKLYFSDFCYKKEIMDEFVKTAESVTVLDHHLGIEEVVESMPEYVFDNDRSGATITWSYFHPNTPVPKLLEYVQDGDLYVFKLADSRKILAYAYTGPFTFEHWDKLAAELETPEGVTHAIAVGGLFMEYHENIVENAVHHADIVEFEGYECYVAKASPEFVSDVGNRLARLKPPIALILSADAERISVSLRSDRSVDVSAIARKYGGNGHPAAAAFILRYGDAAPWTVVPKA